MKFDVIYVDGGYGVSLCRIDISNSIWLVVWLCILILDDIRVKCILDVYKEYEDLGFLIMMLEFVNLFIEVYCIVFVVFNY